MKLLPALVAAAALAVVTSHVAISTALAAPADQVTCPATFTVLHDDHIGRLALPAGPYTVTLLDRSPVTCAAATRRLAAFLQDFDGRLPGGWKVEPATATFTRDRDPTYGFRIAPAVAPPGREPERRHQRVRHRRARARVHARERPGQQAVPAALAIRYSVVLVGASGSCCMSSSDQPGLSPKHGVSRRNPSGRSSAVNATAGGRVRLGAAIAQVLELRQAPRALGGDHVLVINSGGRIHGGQAPVS